MNTRMLDSLRFLIIDCVDFILPGWMDCVMAHYGMVHTIEPETEQYMPPNVQQHCVVKNNKLDFDFNPN
jgi:hypothetical protein